MYDAARMKWNKNTAAARNRQITWNARHLYFGCRLIHVTWCLWCCDAYFFLAWSTTLQTVVCSACAGIVASLIYILLCWNCTVFYRVLVRIRSTMSCIRLSCINTDKLLSISPWLIILSILWCAQSPRTSFTGTLCRPRTSCTRASCPAAASNSDVSFMFKENIGILFLVFWSLLLF